MGRHAGKCATGLFRRRKVDPYHERYRGRSLLPARQCSKTFLAPYDKPLDGMCLLMEQAEMILKMLVDGMSVSAIERMTGLTNAFSKKWENHWAAMSLWYTFYNFCRVQNSLRATPAMAAGITDRVWDLTELFTV